VHGEHDHQSPVADRQCTAERGWVRRQTDPAVRRTRWVPEKTQKFRFGHTDADGQAMSETIAAPIQ